MSGIAFSPHTLFLAPLAGLTHPGLRTLIHEFGGCDYYYTEMISARAFTSNGLFESFYESALPDPDKIIHQIVGPSIEDIVACVEKVDGLPGLGIDINMGCSAPEIVRQGGGIVWMKTVENAKKLVSEARYRTKKLLSVKIRIGFEENPDFLLNFARTLESCGIDYLVIHPRIKQDKLSRPSRWEHVAMLKRELRIPVIGNGDITTWTRYSKARENSSCDAVMIGRKAVQSPWFFSYLKKKVMGDSDPFTVNLEETALRFLELLAIHQPVDFHPTRAKRFLGYFSKNLFFDQVFAGKIHNLSTIVEFEKMVKTYFSEHPDTVIYTEKDSAW